MKCGECKYWDTETNFRHGGNEFRECKNTGYTNNGHTYIEQWPTYWYGHDSAAIIAPGHVITGKDFGCIHFKII